jgi:hypothetical protein
MLLVVLLAAAAVQAADEPLRVYAYGAPNASVYVTPIRFIGPTEASGADIGAGTFRTKYLRGRVPLEIQLRPGKYLVSVMQAAEKNMRDLSLDVHEMVWDGYDYHALVAQNSGRWRYAQCYLVEKVEGFALEVLAVFTDRMSDSNVLSFNCGSGATRYAGQDEDAAEALTAAGIPMTFHEDIIRGLRAGHKLILNSGLDRFAVQCDGPANVRLATAAGAGVWAGHRLSTVTFD